MVIVYAYEKRSGFLQCPQNISLDPLFVWSNSCQRRSSQLNTKDMPVLCLVRALESFLTNKFNVFNVSVLYYCFENAYRRGISALVLYYRIHNAAEMSMCCQVSFPLKPCRTTRKVIKSCTTGTPAVRFDGLISMYLWVVYSCQLFWLRPCYISDYQ